MTFAVLLTGTSQGHTLIQGHIVADNGGLTDDDTVTVIDEKSFADLCTGMDLDAGLAHTSLGNIPRPEIMSAQVQLMRQSVMDHDLETGIQKDLHGGMDRRITFLDNTDFFF